MKPVTPRPSQTQSTLRNQEFSADVARVSWDDLDVFGPNIRELPRFRWVQDAQYQFRSRVRPRRRLEQEARAEDLRLLRTETHIGALSNNETSASKPVGRTRRRPTGMGHKVTRYPATVCFSLLHSLMLTYIRIWFSEALKRTENREERSPRQDAVDPSIAPCPGIIPGCGIGEAFGDDKHSTFSS